MGLFLQVTLGYRISWFSTGYSKVALGIYWIIYLWKLTRVRVVYCYWSNHCYCYEENTTLFSFFFFFLFFTLFFFFSIKAFLKKNIITRVEKYIRGRKTFKIATWHNLIFLVILFSLSESFFVGESYKANSIALLERCNRIIEHFYDKIW